MSERLDFDVLVAGGGMAGLAMTARLAAAGLSAVCVEAGPRPSREIADNDKRTAAVLMPGIETLRRAGAWDAMAAEAQPMQGLRILDCGGAMPDAREDVLFGSDEIGEGPFGYNIENGRGRLALADRLEALGNARLIAETRLAHWLSRRDAVVATLDDGTRIRARLLVGADGRRSFVRERAQIGHREWGFGQTILACRIRHDGDHACISTEMHHVGGPLTFVPLPGNASGVVWMNPEAEADRLLAMDDETFREDLQERSQGVVGRIESVANRASWPAKITVATGLTAPRVVLIAEAAHAFPPIGAQGLNTSLRDVETLAQIVEGTPDPGEASLLSRYARRRMPDILARTAGVDLLNRSVLTSLRPIRDLRRAGLVALDRVPPLKRMVMRAGFGG